MYYHPALYIRKIHLYLQVGLWRYEGVDLLLMSYLSVHHSVHFPALCSLHHLIPRPDPEVPSYRGTSS